MNFKYTSMAASGSVVVITAVSDEADNLFVEISKDDLRLSINGSTRFLGNKLTIEGDDLVLSNNDRIVGVPKPLMGLLQNF